MTQYHDFKDGKGPVPAHRHNKGHASQGAHIRNAGGWVADSAYVYESSSVSSHAEVFGLAYVGPGCFVCGISRVGGRAKLFNTTLLGASKIYYGEHTRRHFLDVAIDSENAAILYALAG